MRRITKAALGGVASCALILGGTQVAGGALLGTYKYSRDGLTDLLSTDGPFDDAKAKITISLTDAGGTTISIRVTGIDTSSLTPESLPVGGIGAHLHVGSCDDPGAHYKLVDLPPPADRDNEFWFDLIPDAYGMAYDVTTMPFVPIDEGKMSIVIHEKNAQDGGTKQACFPLDVLGIFPTV